MKLPSIPKTHSMLCLTSKEEKDSIGIHAEGKSMTIFVRKARNGRANVILIAPRDWQIRRNTGRSTGNDGGATA